ncbi:hypothetical protein CI238_00918 [Colletotrichum incanum]|uniref:Uncharacterized protein n=1 Tax=Colletotrichum incanum TaxID=1573173 RepID=A0A166TI96_COLIC|nr:hypothetical protein CI238_00918 [Colletotrichum incanum]
MSAKRRKSLGQKTLLGFYPKVHKEKSPGSRKRPVSSAKKSKSLVQAILVVQGGLVRLGHAAGGELQGEAREEVIVANESPDEIGPASHKIEESKDFLHISGGNKT